jgi:DNA-binding transcriptional LysR family regulator
MHLRSPSFRQLEALVAVLETGSLTRAAERIHISQPAISRLIATLEADVGYPMFRRAGGRIVPTAEAALLREEIQNTLTAFDRVSRRALKLGSLTHGQLTVCAFPSFAATILPLFLSRFHVAHPEIPIVLNGMNFHGLLETVASQRADFAISDLPPHANGVVAEHLCRYQAVCIVRPDHPFAALSRVPLMAFAHEDFILMGDEDERQPTVSRAFQDLGIELQYPIEVSLSASACAWVAAAGGCAVVDPFSAGEWRGQLVRVKTDPPIWFDIWILSAEGKPLTRLASAVLSLLREYVLTVPGVSVARESDHDVGESAGASP